MVSLVASSVVAWWWWRGGEVIGLTMGREYDSIALSMGESSSIGQTSNTMLLRNPKGQAMNRSKRHTTPRNTHADHKCHDTIRNDRKRRAAIREAIARRELRTMGA